MRTKQDYLQAMGVDVWVRRELLPTRAPAKPKASRDATAGGPAAARQALAAANAAAGRQAPEATQRPAARAGQGTGSAPPPATTDSAQLDLTAKSAAPDSAASAGAEPAATPGTKDSPQFKLAFIQYPTLGLCLHLEGALPERFCDNLAIALAQDIERKQVKPPLEWPMVGKGIDQSLEAARQVVAHHIAQLPPLTLVFGEAMPHYYPPLEAAKPNGETTTEGRRLLLLPGVEAVMQSATLKRELWQRLQG